MTARSALASILLRAALLPLDRPGLALVVSLGVALAAGAVIVAGAMP